MGEDVTRIQERLAYLERAVEDLSDMVARQDRELQRLTARVATLTEREAERELHEGGGFPLADRKPPHW